MSYTRVNWQNSPNTATPLSAENLNKMDAGIKQNADDIEQLQQHTYDEELDGTSTNAPQTKAVYEALQQINIETDPTLSVSGKAADAAATGEAIADVKTAIDKLIVPVSYTESDGYFSDSGAIQTPTASSEKYTSKIPVVSGEKVEVLQTIDESRGLWIAYCLYNSSETIVGSRTTLNSQNAVSAGGIVTIPDGVSYIAFCYRTYSSAGRTSSFSIKKYFDEAYIGNIAEQVSESQDANRRLEGLEGLSFPFAFDYVYHHMFLDNVDAAKTIPPQSIWDVQVAHRLGFHYIEANVHATATPGKYVVTHGSAGKLGGDFETIDGGDASTVVISNTSFDDLRTLYRYKSLYAKYRGPITSLEEFLYQCKSLNLYPVLGYVDDTELQIAQGIVGNNMILYNGSRAKFNGFIMEYRGETSKAAIVSRCKTVGRPYMYCMANPTAFTDADLKDIVAAVHGEGCYIGCAGVYLAPDASIRLKNLGFDFSASGCEVPYFETGNLLNICDDIAFGDVVTTGTVTDNNIVLANDQTVTISDSDTSFIKKYVLEITYSGTIKFTVPRYTVPSAVRYVTITSDGRQSIVFSGVKIRDAFSAVLTASGDATIYNLSCKLSKC